MNSRLALLRLLRALQRELHKHRGQVGDLEIRLGHRRGYLYRVLRGPSLNLGTFLGLSRLLVVDPVAFLASCFGGEPERLPLGGAVGEEKGPPVVWRRIEALLGDLEERELETKPPVRTSPAQEKDVDTFLACTFSEQRRRLRQAARYRSLPFLEALLWRLEEGLEEHPETTWRHVEVLLLNVLPRLPEARRRLFGLACRMLGLWAEARAADRRFEEGSLALVRGLELARAHGLKRREADLLRAAARLLWRWDQPRRAMALLERSQLVCYDLGERSRLGQVLSERGAALLTLGDARGAGRLLTQALGWLGGGGPPDLEARRRVVRLLVRASEARGDLSGARFWTAKALQHSGGVDSPSVWEKLPGAGLRRRRPRVDAAPHKPPPRRRSKD